MTGLNIVFAGTPEFGVPSLEALSKSKHQITAVYTQPDRPAGRGCKLQASAVKEWAMLNEVPVFQPLNFKSQHAIDELKALKPDLMVVIAYGLILPQVVLDIPRLGCINVHASLLPRWRGASPIQHAVLFGDKLSGVTIMQMDAGMDTGDMLAKVTCELSSDETSATLHDKLAQMSPAPLVEVIDAIAQNLIVAEPQGQDAVTYAPKITKEQAQIDWHLSAFEIDCRIRAYTPWPVAYTLLDETVLRIHKASIGQQFAGGPPGTVLKLDKKSMLVATGTVPLIVEKIQFSGGKVISIADYLNSGKNQLHEGVLLQ